MNLLARKKESGLLLLAGLMLVWGCKEDLGIELPPDIQRTQVSTIELTLPVTTVYFDSLRTDKEGILIVGQYSDTQYGSITAKGFTEYNFKVGAIPTTETFRFVDKGDYSDSLADYEFAGARLVMDIDRVLTDDGFFDQTLELRLLSDSIFSEGIYLSNRTVPEGDIIGGGAISLPHLASIKFDSTARVPVSVLFTEEFSNFLKADFEDNGTTRRRFGFSINALSGNGLSAIDVNSDSTEIQLLYRGNLYDTATQSLKKDTTFAVVRFGLASSNHFTNVIRDRSGSLISGLTDGQAAEVSPDVALFNELAGVHTKIDLTPFLEFAETEPGLLVNRASLSIEVNSNDINIPNIQSTSYYFPKNTDPVDINWPSIFQTPSFYRTVLQNDVRYLSPSSQQSNVIHRLDTLNSSPLSYQGNPTIFWQYLYDNVVYDLDNVEIEDRPTIHQFLAEVKSLLMVNSTKLTLGRSAIKSDGVKLKLYYTKPRE